MYQTVTRAKAYSEPQKMLKYQAFIIIIFFFIKVRTEQEWRRAAISRLVLLNLERGQKRLRALVANELFSTLKPLSHRRNVSFSLLYRYFYSRCSHKLNFLVPTADFHS